MIALDETADWRYHPEIADDERKAQYLNDTLLEVVVPSQMSHFPTVAIFDHDGTISTLRQGWEAVMERVCGCNHRRAYESLPNQRIQSLKEDIHEFIDRTTGIQTIEQMYYLVELVHQYGYVPKEQILTADI